MTPTCIGPWWRAFSNALLCLCSCVISSSYARALCAALFCVWRAIVTAAYWFGVGATQGHCLVTDMLGSGILTFLAGICSLTAFVVDTLAESASEGMRQENIQEMSENAKQNGKQEKNVNDTGQAPCDQQHCSSVHLLVAAYISQLCVHSLLSAFAIPHDLGFNVGFLRGSCLRLCPSPCSSSRAWHDMFSAG